MMMSLASSSGLSAAICWSTGSPALTMMMTGRGGLIAATKSSSVAAGCDPVRETAGGIAGKLFRSRSRPIVDGNVIAVVGDVERQIGAHDAQSDHTYFRLRHAKPLPDSRGRHLFRVDRQLMAQANAGCSAATQ
jgi:hypothetical protein